MTAKAVIAGLNGETRLNVRNALKEVGISNFSYANSTSEMISSLKIGESDISVFDVDFDEGKAIKALKSLRLDQLGKSFNPYVTVICTSWTHDTKTVQKAISAGVDDLLLFPLSMQKLKSRIEHSINERKPFIVTSDYIGPERRKDPNRESEIPYFYPPNSLQMSLAGEVLLQSDLEQAIEQARSNISVEHLKREAFQIAFLARVATEDFMNSGPSPSVAEQLRKMNQILLDLERRNKELNGPDISELANSLRSTLENCHQVQSEKSNSIEETVRMLRLIEPISRGIAVLLGHSGGEGALIHEIGSSVATFRSRQR